MGGREARRLCRAEPFQLHPPRRRPGDQGAASGGIPPRRAKLDRGADHAFLSRAVRQMQPVAGPQRRRAGRVAGVPGIDAVIQRLKLGDQQRRAQGVHPGRQVGHLVARALIGGLVRAGAVARIQHVAAGQDGGARGNFRVIGGQQPALARVDVLVGLGGKAPDRAEIARFSAIPAGAHGMRAILDHRDPGGIADLHQPLHVAQMTAHVRDQQHPGPAGLDLRGKVLQIEPQVLVDFHQHRPGAQGGDGAGHGRQGEGIGQHRIARLDPHRAQGDLQGLPARCHGQAIGAALPIAIRRFKRGDGADLAGQQVVAVQAPG